MVKHKEKPEKPMRTPKPAFGTNPLARRGLRERHPIIDLFEGTLPQAEPTATHLFESSATHHLESTATQDSNQLLHTPSTGCYTVQDAATHVAGGSTLTATHVAGGSTQSYTDLEPPATRGFNQQTARSKVQMNVRISAEIARQVKSFCALRNIELHEFWEQAATRELNQTPATRVAHDDMMIFTTHEDIIMRYQEYTGQKWNRRDDREGQKYNQTDIKLLDIAMIQTIEKKLRGNTSKQPIKSFLYFVQELNLLIEQKRSGEIPTTLDEYHKYVLSCWEKRIRPLRDEKWQPKPKP